MEYNVARLCHNDILNLQLKYRNNPEVLELLDKIDELESSLNANNEMTDYYQEQYHDNDKLKDKINEAFQVIEDMNNSFTNNIENETLEEFKDFVIDNVTKLERILA